MTFATRLSATWYTPRITPLAAALWPLSLLFRADRGGAKVAVPRRHPALAAAAGSGNRRRQHHRRRCGQDAARTRARRAIGAPRIPAGDRQSRIRREQHGAACRCCRRRSAGCRRRAADLRRGGPSRVDRARPRGRRTRPDPGEPIVRRHHRRRRPAALRAGAHRGDRSHRRRTRFRQRPHVAGRSVAGAGLAPA